MTKPKSEKEQSAPPSQSAAPSKLDQVEQLLGQAGGVTITELMQSTGWQQHSVRGALAGALKKRGHMITSEKVDGVRRYRIGGAA